MVDPGVLGPFSRWESIIFLTCACLKMIKDTFNLKIVFVLRGCPCKNQTDHMISVAQGRFYPTEFLVPM